MAKIKEKIIVPRGKYILVKQEKPEAKKSAMGLIIPDSVEQEQKARGVVEAVGSEIKDIKKGDDVIFGAYAGEELIVNIGLEKISYRLLYDDDIIAYLK
jgi:chaperonin GroES